MKKILFGVGIIGLAGAAYFYFKKQVELALSYDFNVKNFRFLSLTKDNADITADIKLVNKSIFEIDVLDYDLTIFYRDVEVARTFSTTNFRILPDNSTTVNVTGSVNLDEVKDAFLPFIANVLQGKSIKVSVDGYVRVRFLGIPYTLKFKKDEFEYSQNLLEDAGLLDDWDKLKEKYAFLRKI